MFIDIPDTNCTFYISTRANFLLEAEASFRRLRVAAHSGLDLALAIRTPDGRYLCNDDSDDLSPMIEDEFPAGTYEVWVGGSSEENSTYRYWLGFSQERSFRPREMPLIDEPIVEG